MIKNYHLYKQLLSSYEHMINEDCRDRPPETSVLTTDEEFALDLMAEKNQILEKGVTALNNIAGSVAKSNYLISQSILRASNNILTGLNHIADVMERDSQTKEYYMLLKEIENYEDYCIEHGIIKKIYETMNLNYIAELYQGSIDEVRALVNFIEQDNIERLYNEVSFRHIPPTVFLANVILDESCELEEYHYHECYPNGKARQPHILSPYFNKIFLVQSNNKCMDTYTILKELKEKNDLDGIIKAITEESQIDGINVPFWVYEGAEKLFTCITTINQNIALENLRSLHIALRTGVREHKLISVMANEG